MARSDSGQPHYGWLRWLRAPRLRVYVSCYAAWEFLARRVISQDFVSNPDSLPCWGGACLPGGGVIAAEGLWQPS